MKDIVLQRFSYDAVECALWLSLHACIVVYALKFHYQDQTQGSRIQTNEQTKLGSYVISCRTEFEYPAV